MVQTKKRASKKQKQQSPYHSAHPQHPFDQKIAKILLLSAISLVLIAVLILFFASNITGKATAYTCDDLAYCSFESFVDWKDIAIKVPVSHSVFTIVGSTGINVRVTNITEEDGQKTCIFDVLGYELGEGPVVNDELNQNLTLGKHFVLSGENDEQKNWLTLTGVGCDSCISPQDNTFAFSELILSDEPTFNPKYVINKTGNYVNLCNSSNSLNKYTCSNGEVVLETNTSCENDDTCNNGICGDPFYNGALVSFLANIIQATNDLTNEGINNSVTNGTLTNQTGTNITNTTFVLDTSSEPDTPFIDKTSYNYFNTTYHNYTLTFENRTDLYETDVENYTDKIDDTDDEDLIEFYEDKIEDLEAEYLEEIEEFEKDLVDLEENLEDAIEDAEDDKEDAIGDGDEEELEAVVKLLGDLEDIEEDLKELIVEVWDILGKEAEEVEIDSIAINTTQTNIANTTNQTNTSFADICLESWICDDWSVCLAGQETRTCTDLNSCGTTIQKPSETKSCIVSTDSSTDSSGTDYDTDTSSQSWDTSTETDDYGLETTGGSEYGTDSSDVQSTTKTEGAMLVPTLIISSVLLLFVIGGLMYFLYLKPKQGEGFSKVGGSTKIVGENASLSTYIRKEKRKGLSNTQIKYALLNSGWDANQVDSALKGK